MDPVIEITLRITYKAIKINTFIFFIWLFPLLVHSQDTKITFQIHGVYQCKINLLPLKGTNTTKPVAVIEMVKAGETASIQVTKENLPGEFVIRFDYIENEGDTPYPSEKRIIINKQDLYLWVHPIYCNNDDSTWFQKDERENTTYVWFLRENSKKKETLGLLQNLLLNYDNTNSKLYKEIITEYEKRREAFNQWISEQTRKNKDLFVSNLFVFQYVPQINWKGGEANRKQSLGENYFEGMDFSKPIILKSTNMKEWMDGYVNLYGELATNITLRDSLFTLAGRNAIEKARSGHPQVYGWMVDYFFNGYESFNIEKGIKMLEPYLADPNCLTTRRQEINKRLHGIEAVVSGAHAPNIIMQDSDNIPFELYAYQTEKKHILLLFWSADCIHCQELVRKLYLRQQQMEVQKRLDIIAISLDETDNEILAWNQKIKELIGWKHMRLAEGVRSKVASDYYILSIPVMILLNARTKEIITLPESIEQLNELEGL